MLLMILASWINREQQHMIDYLREENSILRDGLLKATGRTFFTFFSGENPVKICSELWYTMGCSGVCAPINGTKKVIPGVLVRFRSLCPSGRGGSNPLARIVYYWLKNKDFGCFAPLF